MIVYKNLVKIKNEMIAPITFDKENYTKLYKGNCKTNLKSATQTIKSLLTFQPIELIPTFLTNTESLKQIRLTRKHHANGLY